MSDTYLQEPSPPPQKETDWVSLDDEQRIKVLSPTMLVLRRFVRNKLAIVGTVFIVVMFLFSFVGGWLMPYGESQVFKTYTEMSRLYAGVTVNEELRYFVEKGKAFDAQARASFIDALHKEEPLFQSGSAFYRQERLTEDAVLVSGLQEVAQALARKETYSVAAVGDYAMTAGFEQAMTAAISQEKDMFTYSGQLHWLILSGKVYRAFTEEGLAVASYNILDLARADQTASLAFMQEAERIKASGQPTTFDLAGASYDVVFDESGEQAEIFVVDAGQRTQFAVLSRYVVNPLHADVHVSIPFKEKVKEAILNDQTSFSYTPGPDEADAGLEQTYTIERQNQQWVIKNIQTTQIVLMHEHPSRQHLMGTDGNGMDILTRLMYGGRISLMIGFIVVFLETFIGVILGGIAGFFGKWVDNLIMRLVDIFNSIPSIPIIIIIGAVMDGMRVDPQIRMIYLMLILGILGWPPIARMVRGQILSLREQEFMLATEATGLTVGRRIFKHLVPNVIPQLIVISTMSLGGVILMESTLSFLGLGVKYPFASWGNIINAVSNVHVMSNYWFVWIPAGFLILVTVLGFNFIGDGLRDAFDPKMKR